MTGFSARLTTVIVMVLVPVLAGRVAAQTQRFPAFDAERIFNLGDADLDGRMSLDEYRDFLRSSPRMRTAPAATIEPMFRRIDSDGDGFLSLLEYRKSFPQRPGGARPGRMPRRRSRPARTPPTPRSRPSRRNSSRRRSGRCWRRNAESATRARPRS